MPFMEDLFAIVFKPNLSGEARMFWRKLAKFLSLALVQVGHECRLSRFGYGLIRGGFFILMDVLHTSCYQCLLQPLVVFMGD